MKRFVKNCIIGCVIYAMCDMSYQMGKGTMLGALVKADITGSQCMDMLSDDTALRVKFVNAVAKLTKEA